ncbi:MAG TPA: triose-phosphate isomerase [Parachlamydiales bacterium]|nr:triose-phosphate isomerase [Parachlamydiales bacterium]
MRKPIIAGNWKMYKTIREAEEFIFNLTPLIQKSVAEIYLAVPFTALQGAALAAKEKGSILIGAQNMHDELEGAFTGEISARQLRDAGAAFVILGHSERRHLFQESDAFIQRKVKRAFSLNLKVVLCIGEKESERDEGKTEAVLKKQLDGSLKDVRAEELQGVILAYEPVWAIGTGQTATPEMAGETHSFCRSYLFERWGKEAADRIRILYGGSVKPDNIAELMAQPHIDGALVGGASLKIESFAKIINYKA